KPELKRMLDTMEQAKQPVILSAGAIDLESSNSKIVDAIRSATGLGANVPIPAFVAAGCALQELSETRLICVAALELKREDDARALDTALRTIALPKLAKEIGDWMGGITIDVQGAAAPVGGSAPGMPMMPGMPGMPGRPGTPMYPGMPMMPGAPGMPGMPQLPGAPGLGGGAPSPPPRGGRGGQGSVMEGGDPGDARGGNRGGAPPGMPSLPGMPGMPGANTPASTPADSTLGSSY